jgi:hypothetical protein
MIKPEGNSDLGCIGSWGILLVIGIICSIVGFIATSISNGWDNFLNYEQKENGLIGGTLIVAFLPFIIIAIFAFIYSKINKN